ncbi:MAG TPA: polysaccharide biosynthesis/export family protein [Candidatus Acidoferrales bacterium]|nr:polysaccharide biosynthesis/export family protein [Candidatus Acidoferrales bacterium]
MKGITVFAFGLALALSMWPAGLRAQQPQNRPVAMTTESARTAQPSNAQADADHPKPAERNPRYRIQPDDILSISFSLAPELDQPKVMVQPDGYISMPDAGSVHVQGLNVTEAAEALKKAYAGILHDPIIQVDLVDFQKPFFLVFGQVGKPGEYELRHDTTVTQGIAVAGGFAPTGKTQVLLYHRISKDWVEVKKLNIKEILNGKNVNEDVQLYPGDMIFVPEKAITNFRKYVPYGVGTYVSAAPTSY